MKSRNLVLFLFCLFLVGILAVMLIGACSNYTARQPISQLTNPSTSLCRAVQHTRGETCIPLNPQRIMTLDTFILGDVLTLLDVKPIGTAGTEENYNASYLKGKTEGIELIRSIDGQPSLEKILLLHPDLIIGLSTSRNQAIYQQLSQIAPTVLVPWQEISYDWKQRFQDFAAIFGKTETAKQVLDDYNRRVKGLKQALSDRQQQIRALLSFAYPNGFHIALKNSFPGSILDDVGLLSPSYQIRDEMYLSISEETLSEIDGDILFIASPHRNMYKLEQLQRKPLWFKLKAVQQHQVYLVDHSVWRGYNILAAHAVIDDLFQYLVNTP
ncbi:iron-siderophore ABC transporter substrate-binding protein [Chlorogloeopsis sp. ULAP01]|uniref:iron-siderophore ABC transporter substrate-binding protein n=1 Tax=Chlorogloeopsis sp. ULAP01 TaxID=3056483 RepID=UPI0025AA4905|nr:iron-siderophore ABC transporter substrate-binding protein [Chlorogloeopsis sp. ULAP01]MDM9382158.1 iron-siderophore ABC transporter substrate-binding protein [Chlorogloeopsis sp. ULAP01]